MKALGDLRQEKLLKLVNMGASGLTGTLAAGSVAAAKIAAAGTVGVGAIMTAPALITIGAVGVTTSYISYRVFSWYSGTNKNTGESSTNFTAFAWELNTPFPAFLLGENAQVAISIDGYAPVLIDQLISPEEGYNMHIDIDAVPIADLKSGDAAFAKSTIPTEVCFIQEPAPVNENCDMVLFVTAYPVPATFGIPGAMPGVFDLVTITTSSGATQIVSYTFGGGGKDVDPSQFIPRK